MASLLIKNGKIITASDIYSADIYIEGEFISRIGINLDVPADYTIDASGLLVLPGLVDAHTHMEMPFMGTYSSDSFYSGTLAALFGGTTTIIDFAIQKKGQTLKSAFKEWNDRAKNSAVSDYSFHLAITDFNENTRKELKDIIFDYGVTSFKVYMAYKGALMLSDREIFDLLCESKKYGALVGAHCENGELVDILTEKNLKEGNFSPKYHPLSRPEIAEEEATGRFIDLAYAADCPHYIAHMTCEGALNQVRKRTLRNQKVFVETCIQYLLLDESLYDKGFESAKWVMSPPLRKNKDREAIWSGIRQNLVHVVATDHCPFTLEQKKMGEKNFSKIPNGAPGVENRLELLYSEGVLKNRISLNKLVEISSTNPAIIFGLFPKKGTLSVGSYADIVIFNPNEEHTISSKSHHMNCDYSAYEGYKIKGKCKTVLLRGKVVIENGVPKVEKGFGKYFPRSLLRE